MTSFCCFRFLFASELLVELGFLSGSRNFFLSVNVFQKIMNIAERIYAHVTH